MPGELNDLNLVTPTTNSGLGTPGGALGGTSALQAALENRPERRGPGARAGLSLAGLALSSILGGGQGAVDFGTGIFKGLSNRRVEDLELYKEQLAAEKAILEDARSIRSNLTNLVIQHTELAATSDETALNAAMYAGYGINFSPATVVAQRRSASVDKAKAEALLVGLQETQGPGRRHFAAAYFSQVGIEMPEEALDSFAQQGGVFTPDNVFKYFSNWPEILTEMDNNGGVFPYDMALERPAEGGTFSLSEVTKGYLDRALAYHQQELKAGHEEFSFQDAMNVALTEPERVVIRKEYSEFRSHWGEKDAMRQYIQVMGMMGMMGLHHKGLLKGNFDENVVQLFNDMTTAAGTLSQSEEDAADERLVNHFKIVVQEENDADLAKHPAVARKMTPFEINEEAERRATKALVTGTAAKAKK